MAPPVDRCQYFLIAGGVAGQGSNKLSVPVQENSTVGQTEIHWKPSTPYATHGANFCVSWIPGWGWIEDRLSRGTAPLVTRVNTTLTADGGAVKTATLLECELRAGAGTDPPFGIMLAQASDAFTHVFYHFTPHPDWQFGRDGEHPLPP